MQLLERESQLASLAEYARRGRGLAAAHDVRSPAAR
jgi:hypothetical protein